MKITWKHSYMSRSLGHKPKSRREYNLRLYNIYIYCYWSTCKFLIKLVFKKIIVNRSIYRFWGIEDQDHNDNDHCYAVPFRKERWCQGVVRAFASWPGALRFEFPSYLGRVKTKIIGSELLLRQSSSFGRENHGSFGWDLIYLWHCVTEGVATITKFHWYGHDRHTYNRSKFVAFCIQLVTSQWVKHSQRM